MGGRKKGRVIVGKIDQGYKSGGRKKRYLSILCATTPTPGLFQRKRQAINTAPQPSEAQQWLHPLHRKAASEKQKTKEKPVRRGRENIGRSSQYIKKKTHITIATLARGECSIPEKWRKKKKRATEKEEQEGRERKTVPEKNGLIEDFKKLKGR